MAQSRKGAPPQGKHFQRQDHAHAAHQEDVSRGHDRKFSRGTKAEEKSRAPTTGHPVERTPKGPSKGQ